MPVNRAESHTSGARFVRQPARWPKPLPKKTTPQTWLNFTRNFDFYQNPKTLCEPKRLLKKDKLYFEPKQLLKRGNILCWPERLLKKGDFYFYQNLCRKKTSRFWKPTKPNHEHCKKKRHSQSKPTQTETQAKNLEADFSDSTKPTWTYASEETTAKQKRLELENLLAEKILTNTLLWKVPLLKTTWFYELKTTTPKKIF